MVTTALPDRHVGHGSGRFVLARAAETTRLATTCGGEMIVSPRARRCLAPAEANVEPLLSPGEWPTPFNDTNIPQTIEVWSF